MVKRPDDLRIGLAAGACAGALAVVESVSLPSAAGAVVVGLLLATARPHPRVTWIAACVVLAALAATSNITIASGLLAGVHAFSAGRWDTRSGGMAGAAALVAAFTSDALREGQSLVPALLVIGAGWGAGRALGERELVAAQLAERVRELDEEREAHAALSVRYERARIASELHDIVAHAISVMVIQASAGQRLAARDPERTAEAFDAIAGAARQAEADMGRLVALLGDDAAIGPAPDLALVDELVNRAAGSGLDVTLRLGGEREGLPAEIVHTAYRVVQEGLTNALRYAAGAVVAVRVAGGSDALSIEVENGPPRVQRDVALIGTGNGLRGLRERVGACGGTLHAGPTGDCGWLITARLPRRPAASPAGMTDAPQVHPAG